ncbi:malonyl-acyl carrier protein transacylase [Plasmopara halstedii]|uniref:[acyl-carrier-protein] S-malonyltransferase n=1 Tax=Plasmopara halstedii TaxID=4781 RepID=A0A0P1ABF0_PLAHL|nr:malonyl-acyl carrier protein transacylase [Plasmopara halstedii]CEG37687.1 malonyl-acyl carrier protein transacylase [Plasmopara halstedii]|eukprot:XP_024574056.1 malonyl-acyl carrier protein transacylase [Plasmopara halstedii]
MTPRRLALVFPGQGSQRVGMCKDLLADWPRIVGDVLEEASEATGLNLKRRMTEGPNDELTSTHVAQPALLSMSMAVLRVLQHEVELPSIRFTLGHSLGEYSALVAGEAIKFADAAHLVYFRGLAMQRAVAPGVGAMAALQPVCPKDAETLCHEAALQTGKVCQVANYNSIKQTVISGDARTVKVAIAQAKATEKARRAVLLNVSAPFHCALMEPAKLELHEQLKQLLSDNKLHKPKVPVVWNVEGRATTKSPDEIAEVLKKQVVHAVRWSDSIDYCVAKGVNEFLELGVGGVLTGLIRQHLGKGDVTTTSCGTTDDIKAFLKTSQQ